MSKKRSRKVAFKEEVEFSNKLRKEENGDTEEPENQERSKCASFGDFILPFVVVESRFKAKHSLDSDEEDEVKEVEKKGLGDEDLAAQEEATIVCHLFIVIYLFVCLFVCLFVYLFVYLLIVEYL